MESVENNTSSSNPNTTISSGNAVDSRRLASKSGATSDDDCYIPFEGVVPYQHPLDGVSFSDSTIAMNPAVATNPSDDEESNISKVNNNNNNNNSNSLSIAMDDEETQGSFHDSVDDSMLNGANGSGAPSRRVRFKYTKMQLRRFEDYFRVNMFPDSITREEISKELDIPVRNVQVWFKNRRAKHRKSAQLDTPNSSSYLESSTTIQTPDRTANYPGPTNYTGGMYNAGTTAVPPNMSQQQNFQRPTPPNQQLFMMGGSSFHPSATPHTAAPGMYYMSHPSAGTTGTQVSGGPSGTTSNNSGNNNSANVVPSPLTNNRMVNFQGYPHPPMMPNFYRNEKFYGNPAFFNPVPMNAPHHHMAAANPIMLNMLSPQQQHMVYQSMSAGSGTNQQRENIPNSAVVMGSADQQRNNETNNINDSSVHDSNSNQVMERHDTSYIPR